MQWLGGGTYGLALGPWNTWSSLVEEDRNKEGDAGTLASVLM